MAYAAPGEFAANALLRIATLNPQQPFQRRSAMRSFPFNAGFLERAFGQIGDFALTRCAPRHPPCARCR
jgi:hypothetical protein